MKKNFRKPAAALLACTMLLTSFAVPAYALETDQAAVDAAMQFSGAASLQYALIEGGSVTLSGSAGVYSKTGETALTNEHIYGIGSVSKVYTAVAVMKLQEAGLLSIDTPVTTYIPEFTMADERYKDITVRMLINHSSGLYGTTFSDGFMFGESGTAAMDNILARLSTQKLKADPGAFSVYCNDGFTLAELVVERVSGKNFTEYIHEIITTPLGLTHTLTPDDSFDTETLTKTYYGVIENPLPVDALGIIGAGGIYANAEDLARFGSMFYTETVLSQASLDAMAAPEYDRGIWPDDEDNTISYGLGWDNVELFPFEAAQVQVLSKGGDTLNYHAQLVVLPEYDMAAAVVSSGGVSTVNAMLAESILIDALAEKGVIVDETTPALPAANPAVPTADVLAKAGYYAGAAELMIDITEDGKMTIEQMPDMTFTYMDDGTFRDDAGTMAFTFVTEENGNVYLHQKAYAALPGLTPMVSSMYVAQFMPTVEVPEEYKAAWAAYSETPFIIVNEKYNSQAYLYFPAISLVGATVNEYGYLSGLTVIDETTLIPTHTIPGTASRDTMPVISDGSSYVQANSLTGLYGGDMTDIFAGSSSVCTIQPGGYATVYSAGLAAGKTITVETPANSAFYVYDSAGMVVASSMFGVNTATVPEGGYILFAGEVGSQFKITMQ